jgi:hypothetical protein
VDDKSGSPEFPMHFATSLFSFLYHLASYEAGGEALVSSGLLESLLKVVAHPVDVPNTDPDYIPVRSPFLSGFVVSIIRKLFRQDKIKSILPSSHRSLRTRR